jgi:PAS domain S-box-containing protein
LKNSVTPSAREKLMRPDDFIVSKTDPKGHITYGNETFIEFSGYSERELLGTQHNIIRHPDMPRGVFRYLWDNIRKGDEVFAYVKNMAKDGSFYWVMANVTPDVDAEGRIVGYLSVRRAPRRQAIATIEGLYRQMLELEAKVGAKDACDASIGMLVKMLKEKGLSYEELVLAL